MTRQNEVQKFVQMALECSVFLAPLDPGLTYDELIEVGKREHFQAGEIGDAFQIAAQFTESRKLIPAEYLMATWSWFVVKEEPDFRNVAAFDFIHAELNARVRADGAQNARVEKSVVVERAVAQGISRLDMEATITILLLTTQLTQKEGLLRYTHGGERTPLPSEQLRQMAARPARRREGLARVFPIVKDIIERRTDGRPRHAEPLDAFGDAMEKLGYGTFRLWWKQTVAELRRADSNSYPVMVCVLSAALVEGALTLVVKHARGLGLGVFQSDDFASEPRTWRIDRLVASAASGSESAILDGPSKNRAEALLRHRQRIHAGRVLAEYPSGAPDLRPEEARESRETAELVVRRVLDWLERYPSTVTRAG